MNVPTPEVGAATVVGLCSKIW